VTIKTESSLRIEVGKNGTFDVSTEDEVNAYYIYTEHKSDVIDMECSSGSLANLD